MPDRSSDRAVEASRVAESRSYEELYVEHAPAARRLALSMVPPDVADDVVAEAFARVLAVIREGGGPSHAFRGYLLTAVRNVAHDWQRARRRLTVVAGPGHPGRG
jgi:RNA polymerase sigma factor (sigma-70 family)